MSFSDLEISSDIEESGDRLPADRSYAQESGVYPVRVDLAYEIESSGGARGLVVHFVDEPFKGFTVKHTFYLTSGRAKGQKNYYTNSDGVRQYLPGFNQADHLARIITGKHITQLKTEEKVVKLWNFEEKKELPTKVQVCPDLIGGVLQIGLLKIVQNRRANVDGQWVNTATKQEINDIDKLFYEDGLTVTEKTAGETEAKFLALWKDKNDGRTVNKYEEISESTSSGTPGLPASSGTASAPMTDKPLFS